MSNSDTAQRGFLRKVKSGSTSNYFILFALFFVVVSWLFFIILDYNRRLNSDRWIALSAHKEEFSDLRNGIETETQNSLKSCLLFNISNKETDRFQTIYSLRATKDLFNAYSKSADRYDNHSELNTALQSLNQLLTDYDHQIAESINSDGKLTEIVGSNQPSDSTGGNFLFEESSVGAGVLDANTLENFYEKIQDQLDAIDHIFNMLVRDEMEAIQHHSPVFLYIAFALMLVSMLMALGLLITKRLKSSILGLKEALNYISKGELPKEDIEHRGEFGEIAKVSNQLVNYLDDASQFAVKIGDGDFNYEFKPKSKQDALGNSLIDMRNRLQEVAKEDKIRNLVNEGQAKFGEILRQHSNDIEGLGTRVIINLVEYLNASLGALFVFSEDGKDKCLELLATYAYKRKKHIHKRIELGEGLVGQAFEEGKTIYMTDIKTDHYNIQTGLGESRPSSLLIVPLKDEERIEGVIEIASLNKLEEHQIGFVESIGESIASSLSAGKVNETTKKLLRETQEKAEQMKAQEEELRQNMEELAATQEQMARRNKEMEEVQQKLSEEKYLMNALLSSTNDRIYFKDRDSKFIRVSKSMIELFEKKDESEILGKSDFDFGFEEHAKVAFEDEQRIIHTEHPMVDVIEKEEWDDGHITWVSTTKNPLRDLEGKVVGTFGISRDVTKNKLVELEVIKRKDWFDNFFRFHPVGFLILEQNGKINYGTNSILSKLNKEKVEGLKFEDVFRDKKLSDFLSEIDYENTKDKEVEISLTLKSKSKDRLDFLAISGSKQNEDRTQNIFLIQK